MMDKIISYNCRGMMSNLMQLDKVTKNKQEHMILLQETPIINDAQLNQVLNNLFPGKEVHRNGTGFRNITLTDNKNTITINNTIQQTEEGSELLMVRQDTDNLICNLDIKRGVTKKKVIDMIMAINKEKKSRPNTTIIVAGTINALSKRWAPMRIMETTMRDEEIPPDTKVQTERGNIISNNFRNLRCLNEGKLQPTYTQSSRNECRDIIMTSKVIDTKLQTIRTTENGHWIMITEKEMPAESREKRQYKEVINRKS